MASSDAEQIRRNTNWAKKVLGRALAGDPEDVNNHLPPPEGPEEIARYMQLENSADAIIKLIDEGKALPYDLVLEYGFLHHINVGWGLGVQNKFFRGQGNKARHKNADPDVLAALANWRASHPGLTAADAVEQFVDYQAPILDKQGHSTFSRRRQSRLKTLLRQGEVPPK
jgi:hypothetical protein